MGISAELQALYNSTFGQGETGTVTAKATVHSYIRFSSSIQEQGDSITRQVAATKQWAASKGLEVSEQSFSDLGISGYKQNAKRDGLDQLLEAIETDAIKRGDWVSIEKFDRLSRQGIRHTTKLIERILDSGVNLVAVHDNLELTKDSLDDSVKVIQLAIYADIAHKQSAEKSYRVSAAKASQRKAALSGEVTKRRLCWWLSRDNDKYVLNKNAKHVKAMIEMRLAGNGWRSIAKHFNEQNILSRTGKKWSDNAIKCMITNRAVYGSYEMTDGNIVDNYYDAICSYSDWKILNSKSQNYAGGKSKTNAISGLVRCSCGSSMSLKMQTRKTKTKTHLYRTWICRASTTGACDNTGSVRDLDVIIKGACSKLKYKKLGKAAQNNSVEIEKTKDRLDEIRALMTDVNSSISVSELAVMAGSLQSKITELEAQELEETTRDELKQLKTLTDDTLWNIKAKQLIRSCTVTRKSKNVWHIKIIQKNSYVVNATIMRESQRKEVKVFYGNKEAQVDFRDEVTETLFDGEEIGDYDSYEVD
ncbi:recombinase family protein [Vibrio alginolyticus]